MAEVEFNAQTYFDTAREHLDRALELHRTGQYFLAHYVAGVAIECILRAYSRLVSADFEGRHDLKSLSEEAHFVRLALPDQQIILVNRLNEANIRWRSNHRYYTEKQLLKYLGQTYLDVRVRGNRLKYNSMTMCELARAIVNLGVQKWTR